MKLSALLPMAVSALLLTACGGDKPTEQTAPASTSTNTATTSTDSASSTGSSESATAGQPTDLMNRINNKGVLVVGTEGTYKPFTYHDESGKLTGYDVEVVRAIAGKLGMTVEFKETQWDGMLAGLDAKRFDVVANQVALTTPERQAKYDKSEPYSWSNAVVVAPTNITLASWDDIKGKKSAQSLTSNYAELATEKGAELVAVDGLAQAIELVKQGRADITMNDRLAVLDYINTHPDSGLEIKLEKSDDKKGAGVIFRKGEDEAVAKFSEVTKELQADGTLTKLSEQFFGADVSKK